MWGDIDMIKRSIIQTRSAIKILRTMPDTEAVETLRSQCHESIKDDLLALRAVVREELGK